jgi:hypothetical protein
VEGKYEILGGFLSPVGDAYGKKGLERALHRVNMCKDAVMESDWISVDTWESEQAEYKPTLQVMRHLQGNDFNGGDLSTTHDSVTPNRGVEKCVPYGDQSANRLWSGFDAILQ